MWTPNQAAAQSMDQTRVASEQGDCKYLSFSRSTSFILPVNRISIYFDYRFYFFLFVFFVVEHEVHINLLTFDKSVKGKTNVTHL